jgi:hypothetical protein
MYDNHTVEAICVAIITLVCVFAPQVISCVGAPESATLDPSAPRRIDGDGSVALVEAAAAAGVKLANLTMQHARYQPLQRRRL